jgi:hypothetical protein
MKFGEMRYLTEGEIEKTTEMSISPVSSRRVWEYWARRCGMLDDGA